MVAVKRLSGQAVEGCARVSQSLPVPGGEPVVGVTKLFLRRETSSEVETESASEFDSAEELEEPEEPEDPTTSTEESEEEEGDEEDDPEFIDGDLGCFFLDLFFFFEEALRRANSAWSSSS